MNIVSWNINGLRKHETFFRKMMDDLKPDICCLQEIRTREDLCTITIDGYRSVMNPADLSQYYGTGIYIKNTLHPISMIFDEVISEHGYEGRVIATEFKELYIVNSYWPFSAYHKEKAWLKHRIEWDRWFLNFINKLQKNKPVIICGDMNFVHQPIDAFDGKSVKKVGCFYPEEHEDFELLLKNENLVDVFRYMNPQLKQYTEWSNSENNINRKNNQGFRIDYFLANKTLLSSVRDVSIHDNILGTDHCPIELFMEI